MNDKDTLLGELKEFRAATVPRLKKIEDRLDDLWGFRMKILGATSFAGFLGGALVSYFLGIR